MTEVTIPLAALKRRPTTKAAPKLQPARVARQLALAHALQGRLDSGEFWDHADMARSLGFTRARVSQLMDLLLIAPDIQEEVLFLEFPPGSQPIHEHDLRGLPTLTWDEQRKRWSTLMAPVRTRLSA